VERGWVEEYTIVELKGKALEMGNSGELWGITYKLLRSVETGWRGIDRLRPIKITL